MKSIDLNHAVTLLKEWEGLTLQNTIEPSSGEAPTVGEPHHAPEQMFFLALEEAGLVGSDGPELNATIPLGTGLPTTYPDAVYKSEKVAIYLVGLSKPLHGAARTAEFDAMVTALLINQGWKSTESHGLHSAIWSFGNITSRPFHHHSAASVVSQYY